MSYVPPKKKHRWVGPVIVLGVLAGLVIAAFFVADKLARDAAGAVIARPIQSALGSTSKVHVDLGEGIFLLQAASGSIDNVTLSTDGVTVGEGTGSIRLVATGLPLDMGGTADHLTATLSLDATALQSVLRGDGTVSFAGDQFVVATTADLAGVATPVELTITPTAVEGLVALEVTALSVNGEPADLEAVRNGAYGPAGVALATPAPLCVNTVLPASLILKSAAVTGQALVLTLEGSKVPLGSLSTKGVCPEPAA